MVVDILVIAVLLISAGIAFLRGFIREVLTILGVAGGLAAAYAGGPLLSPYMRSWLGVVEGQPVPKLFDMVPYTIVGDTLAYGLIFLIVVVALSLLSHMLAEGARSFGLGAVDRTLGVVFGLARGLILLGLLYLPFHMMLDPETKTAWFQGSRTHFYIEKTAQEMEKYLPTADGEKTKEQASALREKLEGINLLPPAGLEDGAPPEGQSPAPAPEESEGYQEEFRQDMDRLFEQETPPPQPAE
ncbi:MAG: CvpA family protein [Alphaproteobacteria bacterium]|nr:CvpA family protein [Alphaproteobacteria bacterium]